MYKKKDGISKILTQKELNEYCKKINTNSIFFKLGILINRIFSLDKITLL